MWHRGEQHDGYTIIEHISANPRFLNHSTYGVIMGVITATAKELKKGKYVIIDGVPCKVVNIDSSKPGKHGAAKMRVTGIGVFNGEKKVLLTPSDADVEVPIIERKTVQIMSVSGDTANVMDAETYEMFDIQVPKEYVDQLESGKEAIILEAMGIRKFERMK